MMNNPASEHDLQKAIDEITKQNDGGAVEEIATQFGVNGGGEMGGGATQASGAVMSGVAGLGEYGAGSADFGVNADGAGSEMSGVAMETMVVPEMATEPMRVGAEAVRTGQVKEAVLRDLAPLMDKVEMEDDKKFDLYMEMATVLKDESVITKAHEVARGCADESERAKKLLKLVEVINSF